jgi:cell division cycle protein 20 (cofactor of APC complex)
MNLTTTTTYNYDESLDIDMDLSSDIEVSCNGMEPRWQRKQRQQQSTSLSNNANSLNCSDVISDRYIPNRKHQEQMELARYNMMAVDSENMVPGSQQAPQDENSYATSLEQRMFNSKVTDQKILALSEKAPTAPKSWQNNLRVLYSQNKTQSAHSRSRSNPSCINSRHIAQAPERILDAPGMKDDYYLNLLDWNCKNILAVALSDSVYLWNAESGDIQKLMDCASQPDNYISSISWVEDGSYLAIGTNYNEVQLWDVNRTKQVRTMRGHQARVSSLSWNSFLLSSGGKDGQILNHDVRIAKHHISTLQGHQDFEVCGLRWSPDGTQLASGGNDNILNIWDKNMAMGACGNIVTAPRFSIREHTAAVKALAWCPWQSNLLASGGGTSDRKIMFWNTCSGSMLNSIDTGSQVCSIVWSKTDRELVSSHGFSQNQLCVWKYPSLVKVTELTGHSSRVLHLAQSPDGSVICSGAGDETLRFWRVFSTPQTNLSQDSFNQSFLNMNKDNSKANSSYLSMRSIR